jgi:hypothetical protein
MAVMLYAGIRVGPEYLNYYKVVTAMKATASTLKSDGTLTQTSILSSLQRRFDTGYIDYPLTKDIVVTAADGVWTMTADYESTVPMFGNLHITLVFNKSVAIGSEAVN